MKAFGFPVGPFALMDEVELMLEPCCYRRSCCNVYEKRRGNYERWLIKNE